MTTQTADESLISIDMQPIRMDDTLVAHVAGVFDAIGAITVHVSKDGNYSVGYRVRPMLRLHRSADDEALLGMLDSYCEAYGVQYSLNRKARDNSETFQLTVKDPASIRQFIEPMMPYLVSNYEDALVMLDEVLPRIEADDHRTEDGILGLMPYVDTLHESARYGSDSKYTEAYFREEFSGR